MTVDIRTILLAVPFLSLLVTLPTLLLYFTRKRYDGANQWLAGVVLFTIGQVFILSRDHIPDIISIVLGNAVLIIANLFFYNSIVRFRKLNYNAYTPFVIAVFSAIPLFFLMSIDRVIYRIYYLSLVYLVIHGATIYKIFFKRNLVKYLTLDIIGYCFVLEFVFDFLRMVLTLFSSSIPQSFFYNFTQGAYFIAAQIIFILTVVLYIVLYNERMESELIEKNNEKEYANTQLQSQISIKNKLLSIIGHDVKSPLGSLVSLVDYIIVGKKVEPEDIYLFEKIQLQTQSIIKLLESLLVWSNSLQNILVINKKPTSVNELILTVMNIMRPVAQNKQINLVFDSLRNFEVVCDVDSISTALRNLIANAIKFSYINSLIKIDINEENNQVGISIHDEGIGMSKSIINNLFNFDTRNIKFGTDGEKGSGLGLLLCRELIEQNNGELDVSSIEGKGSVFTIRLPLAFP